MSGVDDRAWLLALIARQPAAPRDRDGVMGSIERLCAAVAQALSASGATVAVMAEDGERGGTAASDPTSERIEELRFLLGEGPGTDAFAGRRPVLVPDLAGDAGGRWPVYTPAAGDLGVRAVFAFPLQVGAARLGIFEVHRDRSGQLSPVELRYALIGSPPPGHPRPPCRWRSLPWSRGSGRGWVRPGSSAWYDQVCRSHRSPQLLLHRW